MDDAILITMGTAFVAVGVLVGLFFCYRLVQAVRSKSWPTVEGELSAAGLRQVQYRGVEAGGGSDGASAVVADFSYSYSVDGQTYTGQRVTFSDHVNKTMASLKKLQTKYQGQERVVVYYNPANPSQSVLIPGPGVYNFTPFITPGLFIAAGYFLMTHDFK